MIEVWIDGRKILFSGDMGPDDSPILHAPAIHYTADCVLVESTYGPSRRELVDYQMLGMRIAEVLKRGGDVLIPTFAIHKSQALIHVLQDLIQRAVLPRETPIYCDSATVHSANRIYDAYSEYHDSQARQFADRHGSLFYLGRYREGRTDDFLKAHAGTPSIFVATSGMLAYAASPRHLEAMAGDSRSAVFLPGYQAPGSIGRQLLDGQRSIEINLEEFESGRRSERKAQIDVRLEVDRISGFSSHAHGQQILEWLSQFERVGSVFVVHGTPENAVAMAEKMSEMGLQSTAPEPQESFTIKGDRVRPGKVPQLQRANFGAPAAVDR
jgi:metallo-beta-lactamase family protein